jgi:hypothetical protein
MPDLSKLRSTPTHAIALPLALLACSGLAACGSSSTGTTGTAANAAAASAAKTAAGASAATTKITGTGAGAGRTTGSAAGSTSGGTGSTGAAGNGQAANGAFEARFAAIRTCLQKDGITLPAHGSGGPAAMFRNPQLPKGVSRAQYAEALHKCGTAFTGGTSALSKRRFGNTRFRQALIVFADCLRQHGVPIPQPNTSGNGPIFSTRGLNTASPKFREARQTCRSTLLAALRANAHRGTR